MWTGSLRFAGHLSNVVGRRTRYASVMENSRTGAQSAFAPLVERFGRHLDCSHDGITVSWSLDGQMASVVPRAGGSVGVTFLDRPRLDMCRSVFVSAAYRPNGGGYALAAHGVSRMVDDLVAFFAGVREPRFTLDGIEDRIDPSR